MSWSTWTIPEAVWTIDGLRHRIQQWAQDDNAFQWETLCGRYPTKLTTSGGRKPRTSKGFVTCLQCLAKGGEET